MKVGTLLTTGVKEVKFDNTNLTVYPNPFVNTIYFTFSGLNNPVNEINIFDFNGRVLISKINENNSIETSSLASGVYLVEFIFKDQSRKYKKVIK